MKIYYFYVFKDVYLYTRIHLYLHYYRFKNKSIPVSVCLCHLKIKSGLFFNDLKFKSVIPWNYKKDVI